VIVVQVAKVVGVLNLVISQLHSPGLEIYRGIITAVYWVVPRYLDSDLQKEVFQQAVQDRTTPGLNLSAINVSGPVDAAYWAVYSLLLIALLYWVLRRREV